MDFDSTVRYVFKKEYKTISVNAELRFFNGLWYMNGGMLDPRYKSMIEGLLNNKAFFDEYIKVVKIIKDKV